MSIVFDCGFKNRNFDHYTVILYTLYIEILLRGLKQFSGLARKRTIVIPHCLLGSSWKSLGLRLYGGTLESLEGSKVKFWPPFLDVKLNTYLLRIK